MRTAAEHGMLVMLASTFRDPAREVEYVAMLRAQRARAILLIGSGFEDRDWERSMAAELDPYQRTGGRVAVLSLHRSLKVDAVLPQNREGAAALARALLDLGHRHFGVLTGPHALTTVSDRLGGFTEALADAGVHVRPEHIVEAAFTRDGGYAAASELLRQKNRPTCVFAVTDVMAIGALAAFRDNGISVPGEISWWLRRHPDRPRPDAAAHHRRAAAGRDGGARHGPRPPLREAVRPPQPHERVAGEVVMRASTAAPAEDAKNPPGSFRTGLDLSAAVQRAARSSVASASAGRSASASMGRSGHESILVRRGFARALSIGTQSSQFEPEPKYTMFPATGPLSQNGLDRVPPRGDATQQLTPPIDHPFPAPNPVAPDGPTWHPSPPWT